MRCRLLLSLLTLSLLPVAAPAQATGNLLRNGRFQDDWLTLLPQNRNHHWCYADGFYNRRDYNPDGWFLSGTLGLGERRRPAGPAPPRADRAGRGDAARQLGHGPRRP